MTQKDIQVIKRTLDNFSHECTIDATIESITAWRRSSHKFQLFLIVNILTLGIVHFISLFIPKMYTCLYCKRSTGNTADYFLIEDTNKKHHLVQLRKITLESNSSTVNKMYKIQFGNDSLLRVFTYQLMTYVYNDSDNSIHGLFLDFSKYSNNEIHSLRNNPNILQDSRDRALFGKNIVSIPTYSLFRYFYYVEIPMNCLILICSVIYFIYADYILAVFDLIIIILMIVGKLLHKFYIKKTSDDKLEEEETLQYIDDHHIYTNNQKYKNHDIIPGDVILLHKTETVPCDCLLLEGECLVNETQITGRTMIKSKTSLAKNETTFVYKNSYNSILLQGVTIAKSHSKLDKSLISDSFDEKPIKAIAMNIGINTFRSNSFASIHLDNPLHFQELYQDKEILFIESLILYIVCVVVMIATYYFNVERKLSKDELIEIIIINSIVIFNPLYHISLCFISLFAMIRLQKEQIICVDESKMSTAGKINTIVFDKTGTLSEKIMIISAYQPVNFDSKEKSKPQLLDIDEKEHQKIKYNHLNYWKQYSGKECTDINIHYLHCLVSCHNLEKVNNKITGNILEREILKKFKWELNTISTQDSMEIDPNITEESIEVYPKNYYKITEKQKFAPIDFLLKHKTTQEKSTKSFKLLIYQRFINSLNNTLSSIVLNSFDESIRFYSKGNAEDILPNCTEESIPKETRSILLKHIENGYRVIACATKVINEYNHSANEKTYMNGLTLLGFILLKNTLKKETKKVIEKLTQMECDLIMATGDSLYTSLSVSNESKLIHDQNIVSIQEVKTDDSSISNEEEPKVLTMTFLNQSHKKEEPSPITDNSHRKFLNKTYDDINELPFQKLESPILDLESLYKIQETSISYLCLSGQTFMEISYHYQKELKKKENGFYSQLMKEINLKGKIFYLMTSDHKEKLISHLSSLPKKTVAMVGDDTNDLAAIMKANVGISLEERKICHFYSKNGSLECVEKIIKTGRATRENFLSLLQFFILATALKALLNVLLFAINQKLRNTYSIMFDGIVLFTSFFSFQVEPDYSVDFNSLYQGPLFLQYSIVKIVGHFLLKGIESITFFFVYNYNKNLDSENESKPVLASYLFCSSCLHVMSSIVAFNFDSLSRKNAQRNFFVSFFLALIEFYFLSLLTLTSWNFHAGPFNVLQFEYQRTNLDLHDDINKLIMFLFGVIDFGLSFLYGYFLYILYQKQAVKLHDEEYEKKEGNVLDKSKTDKKEPLIINKSKSLKMHQDHFKDKIMI